jgi:hypothetical protein
VSRKKLAAMVQGTTVARAETTGTELPDSADAANGGGTTWGKAATPTT